LKLGILGGAFVALAVAAAPASAQLSGEVLDEDGQPLAGVSVEAWNDNGKIAVRLTDAEGLFSFADSALAAETTILWAARLGYRPLRIAVEPGIGHYEIRLEEEAVSVQGVVVEAPREVCTGGEDDEARFLWERVRTRYHPALDTLGVATYIAWAEDIVSIDDIGPLDLPAMAIEQRGSSPQLRFSWGRRVEKQGYAFRTRRVEAQRAFDSWVYAPLHADFAPHLLDDSVGFQDAGARRERRRSGSVLPGDFRPADLLPAPPGGHVLEAGHAGSLLPAISAVRRVAHRPGRLGADAPDPEASGLRRASPRRRLGYRPPSGSSSRSEIGGPSTSWNSTARRRSVADMPRMSARRASGPVPPPVA